jgi:uncharacterized protein YjiS (DUF1127 family)
MTTVAMRLPSGRGERRGTFLVDLAAAIAEGFITAARYQRLSRMSDPELAALGLNREDLPRVAIFGKR